MAKMGGVLGYHFIQSFAPGEVTPEHTHADRAEFAKRSVRQMILRSSSAPI
ncbi:MAG: hypothetical protein ACLUEU_06475 [Oscillospiraceae bacterium]